MNSITIKDIARALNLSTSTVSRALRGSYEISPETKRLVMDYAERMNYRPNPIALSLKENRSRVIGVVVPQIANNFFSQAINGIEEIAYDRGYHVIILQSHESYKRELLTVEQAVARKVDGLLISLSSETSDLSHLQTLHQQGFPIVQFDRVSEQLNAPKVVADNFSGAYSATEHLIQSGRRRIAHITIPAFMSISQERLAGYRAALEANGIPFDESLVRYVGFDQTELEPIVADLLRLSPPPDAFFTASDRLALTCLSTLRTQGVVIPDHVGLVGFTNLTVADLLHPSMTTVMQPAREIGQAASSQLIELIENKLRPVSSSILRIPTRLMVRESTRPIEL
ncbi:LacI family DNA-binding transcriptional regulator [Tellurirhabdus rosea]|uniref:LacI family DNA-binding transcriptional regulator n=1 Tax=Tellurirhabdus rosea TaxID=2674997 RepID=UPI002256E1E5|nr:LacI family DNA-binding transcriptional regulator [Tellurirhabdus rosea]